MLSALSVNTSLVAHATVAVICVLRVLARRDRSPAARAAWLVMVATLPAVGAVLYILFGDLNIGRRLRRRMDDVMAGLPLHPEGEVASVAPGRTDALFDRARPVNGFAPVPGNRLTLLDGNEATIKAMIAAIDAAQDHVHIVFYIWLPDRSGLEVIAAVRRAARRGVACRCIVDGLGSRDLIGHHEWTSLPGDGAEIAIAFPTRWPAVRILFSRLDLRNHRKIVVIDHDVGFIGSQNCATPALTRRKRRYSPWVDIMARVEGPVVWQQQKLFVTDWMTHAGGDIADLLRRPAPSGKGGAVAIAYGTGPEVEMHAVGDIVQIAAVLARDRLIISTPYFVPSEAVHMALRSAALRGVRVRLLLPARNDSHFVALASRSYYQSLLEAGAEILEFRPGLLHAKTLLVDEGAVVFGSANMDRRSFELNYENCMIVRDPAFARAIAARQEAWQADCRAVTLDEVRGWSLPRRMLQNLVATIGPLL